MNKSNILIQLDPDLHASVFDAVVAVDAGATHLLQYQNVDPEQVESLVHGAMFTRGPQDLHKTAVFVGGTDVAAGEQLLSAIQDCFFGPLRVSVMMDSNGANTTASAAVLAVAKQIDLNDCNALVLAGTGSVGKRVGQLLVQQGAHLTLASRNQQRADDAAASLKDSVPRADVTGIALSDESELSQVLQHCDVLVAAGAAGIQLVPQNLWESSEQLKVMVDLNAVPPLGIEGIEVTDVAVELNGKVAYGAIGVGGLKMKIHKAAIARLFESNDQILDVNEIYAIGESLGA
ncbi:MAG: NADP-dependent methylenetetrahydromethanopterin/methylenetetrahydrofolate dehydrogenase [Planctomycetota bacterium]|nr:NADP-dependent methylenetetrahydromethanopterin/methylenetetrahydrofolate dehydrogenase [Planctomycetota bacterium]